MGEPPRWTWPEHGHARLVARPLLDVARERLADATQADVAELVGLRLLGDRALLARLVGQLVPLADDDDREVLAALVPTLELAARLPRP